MVVYYGSNGWMRSCDSKDAMVNINTTEGHISHLTVVNGLQLDNSSIGGIGSYCHEMGHQYGLFECYASVGSQYTGVGIWNLMGFGCLLDPQYKNESGLATCPAELSPWEKATLGFITPDKTDFSSRVELPPIETDNIAIQILDNLNGYDYLTNKSNSYGECFLLEYRRNDTKFGRGLPGEGLLIWHIDEHAEENQGGPDIRLIGLEEANNIDDPASEYRYTVPWFAPLHTFFNTASSPNSDLNSGGPSYVSVTDISEVPSDPDEPMQVTIGLPLAGYSSQKTHDIPASQDGALEDYQVRFIVHNTTGTDTDGDIYLNGGSQHWPYDFRFTNADNGKLSYWIEPNFTGERAAVWVKVDHIAASGSTRLNVYYGNSSDQGESNGDATFILFDDFDDNSINSSKWADVSSGNADVNEQNHELELMSGSGSSSRPFLRTLNNYSSSYVVDVDARYTGSNGILITTDWDGLLYGTYMGPKNAYTNMFIGWGYPNKYWEIAKQVNGGYTVLGNHILNMNNSFHKVTVIQKPQIVIMVDGATMVTANSDTTFNSGHVGLGGREGLNGIQTFYDNFRIRKYTEHPPVADTGLMMAAATFIPTGSIYEPAQDTAMVKKNNTTISPGSDLAANGSDVLN